MLEHPKPVTPEAFHRRESGVYLADLVYGANDGIITTFAVVSGAAGATLASHIIVILGITNLIADGFSMGASSFLSLRSRRSFEAAQRAIEEREIKEKPETEKREVYDIVRSWGLGESESQMVTREITKDDKQWVDFMMREELGIHESGDGTPFKHGLATGIAFTAAGLLPLIPYLFGVQPENRFMVSVIATAVALFAVGSFRSYVTASSWYRSGVEMLLVGGFAAVVAYGLGALLANFLGILA